MDLIDRQQAIKTLEKGLPSEPLKSKYTEGITVGFGLAITWIEQLPAVQPQTEIIRCKDCKYWQDNNGGYPHEDCRWGHDETPDGEDFCSFAERRTDE